MVESGKNLEQGLDSLRIHQSHRRSSKGASRWTTRWILAGIVLVLAVSAAVTAARFARQEIEVEVFRVVAGGESESQGPAVVLNASGYIVAHRKIQLTAKVVGKVAWIGVEKGDLVREGQVLVRLEDAEYQAQAQQAEGQLASLLAQLSELESGSRPEEIARANANLARGQADLKNARNNLDRVRRLFEEEVLPRQDLDNAQARFEAETARVESLAKEADLVRLGPREEQIEAMRGRVKQARGQLALHRTFLDSTVIRAPITGTILEKAVEQGEFVTTSFVGERGAKGYVVTLADLNDLQVELDISQDDFSRLSMNQQATLSTDAFPDRSYRGYIAEIAPEANRQKATVQVKVQVADPDSFLRPEMNAQVAFLAPEAPPNGDRAPSGFRITVPTASVRDREGRKSVLVVLQGRASERPVRIGDLTAEGIAVTEGLIGGEDIVVNPPGNLQDGDRVRRVGN
jgi:HlyD family secretion protein